MKGVVQSLTSSAGRMVAPLSCSTLTVNRHGGDRIVGKPTSGYTSEVLGNVCRQTGGVCGGEVGVGVGVRWKWK